MILSQGSIDSNFHPVVLYSIFQAVARPLTLTYSRLRALRHQHRKEGRPREEVRSREQGAHREAQRCRISQLHNDSKVFLPPHGDTLIAITPVYVLPSNSSLGSHF